MLKNNPLLVLQTLYTCLHTHVCRLTGEMSGTWASPDNEAWEIFWPELSMLSWEITLRLTPQSTLYLLMTYVYIPDVVNTTLGFKPSTFSSDYSMPYYLLSDHAHNSDSWFTSFGPLSLHSISSHTLILNTSLSFHLPHYIGSHLLTNVIEFSDWLGNKSGFFVIGWSIVKKHYKVLICYN